MNDFTYQQTLPLKFLPSFGRHDFIIGESNFEAVKWVDNFSKSKVNGLVIIGPIASGKSHLISTLKNKYKIIEAEDINEEKINILENLGLDHLVIYPFTLEFSKFSAKRYIDELLIQKLGTHTLVIGYDHHFGNDREGNIDLLKKYEKSNPFYLEEIKAHEIEQIKKNFTCSLHDFIIH